MKESRQRSLITSARERALGVTPGQEHPQGKYSKRDACRYGGQAVRHGQDTAQLL